MAIVWSSYSLLSDIAERIKSWGWETAGTEPAVGKKWHQGRSSYAVEVLDFEPADKISSDESEN